MELSLLDFEKSLEGLETKLAKLREAAVDEEDSPEAASSAESPQASEEIDAVVAELDERRGKLFEDLTRWQRVLVSRHPARPHASDYIQHLITDWTELRGDRAFGDDRSLIAGFGCFGERPVAVIGQQKGLDTKDNIDRNFGMLHPEGFRKAMRIMRMAEKFSVPVLVFIDTPGAYPGIGAEERGQGEAIARNLAEMSVLKTPVVCTVIGEGASGGALGVGVGDRLLMLQYAWYSVISPEGCATILWRDASRADEAAEALKITALDLQEFGIIDGIVPEPLGGAHRDPTAMAETLRSRLQENLDELLQIPLDDLIEQRFQRYRSIGDHYRLAPSEVTVGVHPSAPPEIDILPGD